MRIIDAIRIKESYRVDLSISTTAAQTAVLSEGIYDIKADVDCYIKVNPTANNVTVAAGANAGYPLLADNTIPVDVPPSCRIGAVTASGTGTLQIHRVG